MNIAFITDPLDEFKLEKDSTYAMMREAARRGHELHVLRQDDLAWQRNAVIGRASRLHLAGEAGAWYRLDAAVDTPLERFDAVLMRKDPPFDMEYVYSTYLLEIAENRGAKVFNRPRAIRDFNEKMAIARFAQFTAATLVTRREDLLRGFLAEHGDIILKPLDGMGGSSVFRVRNGDPNVSVIIETLTALGSRSIMAQRYLPAISDGDKRVLVIGGEPVPFCLARIPQPGETRGNLAAGGTGVARPLTPRDREIGETLGPQLREAGLLLVGLDVIGENLTEVNVTSPTCFQEISRQSGFDVAAMFLNTLENSI
ncbi:MAG: glutathione synthase [Betaproteobacteria bacterium]|jgi:glutathione synthase|nr:glutathione synthase [Betaproteobacteria bacterium]